jgi:putative spermidine/putrescine transport system substrate-binding protein
MEVKHVTRTVHARATVLVTGLAALAVAVPVGAQDADWSSPPDAAAAAEQAKAFQTYGMPDSWANYGASIAQFCEANGFTCSRTDTDMSSLEEITSFDAEKNNPVASFADIGIMFGPVADQVGVVPPYLPPDADVLSEGLKGPNGGWLATFTGVPGYNVNVDVMEERGIPVPMTWADLIKPEYAGLVGLGAVGSSGTATTSFIAMNQAAGGSMDDFGPGIEYAKALVPNLANAEGANDTMERGEIPIQIKYDFNLIAQAEAMAEKGIKVQTVIPGDGSIYAPSALMLNRYNVGTMDLQKMFSEWVLSDDGQRIFAEFGARPIRYVLGDLELPDDAKAKWLPDDQYANVEVVDLTAKAIDEIKDIWEADVLGQ